MITRGDIRQVIKQAVHDGKNDDVLSIEDHVENGILKLLSSRGIETADTEEPGE